MMKILFILEDMPYPADNGGKIKTYNLISTLSKEHECCILSMGDNDASEEWKKWTAKTKNIKIIEVFNKKGKYLRQLQGLAGFLFLLPPPVISFFSFKMAKYVYKHTKQNKYDLVIFDSINTALYVKYLSKSVHRSICSPNDAFSLAYERKSKHDSRLIRKVYYYICSKLIGKFEKNLYSQFSYVHIVSPVDEMHLLEQNSLIKTKVIPIAVADDYFISNSRHKNSGFPIILFTGVLLEKGIQDGFIDFVINGFPLVTKKFPKVEFVVLGRNIPNNIKKLCKSITNIKLVEWIPNYIEELSRADVIISPDKTGAGMKNRVLQALATGTPIVASKIALEGFEYEDGVHAFCCDNCVEMGERIIDLLNNEELRYKIGKNAQKLAHEKYSFEGIGEKWLELIENIIVDQ